MRKIIEEFGPNAPTVLREPLGKDEYIVRTNVRTVTKQKEDGTVEVNYVCDSTIYTNQEYIQVLEKRETTNSEAIAELADIILGGGN